MQKILKYAILAIFVVNLPMAGLNNIGDNVGALLSLLAFVLPPLYYFFYLVGGRPNYPLLFLGIFYYCISGLQIYMTVGFSDWFTALLKYTVLIFFGNSFFKSVSKKEMVTFLLIGAITVILHSLVWGTSHGRASGFYFNANPAGLACILGYAWAFGLKKGSFKLIVQVIFTLAGFLTFSRTFIIVWVLVNLISTKKNKKNIKVLFIGVGLFISLFVLAEALNLGGNRFDTFKAAINNQEPKTKLDEDSRTKTWANFYEPLASHPFFGNGYGTFSSDGMRAVGVHNTYLLTWGEAGILPLIIFLYFIISLLKKSVRFFNKDDTLLYISVVHTLYFLTLHDFYEYNFMLCMMLFWYNEVEKVKEEYSLEETPQPYTA